MPKEKIWCLFRVANEYDQPENDLVGWWKTKPSIERLAAFLAVPLDKATDRQIVALVDIFKGKRTEWGISRDDYRLEEVEEND